MRKNSRTTFCLLLALLLALPVQSSAGWIPGHILTCFGYSTVDEQEEQSSEVDSRLCSQPVIVHNQVQKLTSKNSHNLELVRALCKSYNMIQVYNKPNETVAGILESIKEALLKFNYKPLFELDGSLSILLDSQGTIVFSSSVHAQQKSWLWDNFMPELYQNVLQ